MVGWSTLTKGIKNFTTTTTRKDRRGRAQRVLRAKKSYVTDSIASRDAPSRSRVGSADFDIAFSHLDTGGMSTTDASDTDRDREGATTDEGGGSMLTFQSLDGSSFSASRAPMEVEAQLERHEPKKLVRHVSSGTRRSSIVDSSGMLATRQSSGSNAPSIQEDAEEENFVETYKAEPDDYDKDDDDEEEGAIKASSRASTLGALRPRTSSIGTAPQSALPAFRGTAADGR